MTRKIDGPDAALSYHLATWGQEHTLRWWGELTSSQRDLLRQQLEGLDLHQLRWLFDQADAGAPAALPAAEAIRPIPALRLAAAAEDRRRDRRAKVLGRRALKAGQVAVILVAGGQGTRLGFDGPKGTYPIGTLSGKSLFQIHAEKVLAVGRRHGAPLPLYIMTGPENDAATRAFFDDHEFFGLDRDQVVFFEQGTMPALDRQTGRLLLAAKDRLATSPNGHGGVLQALADGGHLDNLARRGVQHLFYFQVDNPLVKVVDPTFLGQHIAAGAEMAVKVVPKRTPEEKLGVVVEVDGRAQIIEYSDLPAEVAARRGADGGLNIWAGSIAVHIFEVAFLERLAGRGTMLPYHRAIKAVPALGEDGRPFQPAAPNAVKFEMFVFDALPLARKALVVETSRPEEFEPLKNATGENSPATVRRAQTDLFASWLDAAGVAVPRRADGSAAVPIEISPLVALDAEDLRPYPVTLAVTEPLLLEAPAGPAVPRPWALPRRSLV